METLDKGKSTLCWDAQIKIDLVHDTIDLISILFLGLNIVCLFVCLHNSSYDVYGTNEFKAK